MLILQKIKSALIVLIVLALTSCSKGFFKTGDARKISPDPRERVKKNIEDRLNPEFKGRFKIMLVPNVTNICYGRGVGYKIEEIVLPEEIQKISATKIRAKMREEGKLK